MIPLKLIFELDHIHEAAKQLLSQYPNKIFCFYGEMGAGKTTLIDAMVKQLGSKDKAASPTYGLINQYQYPQGKMYHLDLFRLKNTRELLDLGIEDILYSGAYVFIEWPELAIQLMEGAYVQVQLNKIDAQKREMIVTIS